MEHEPHPELETRSGRLASLSDAVIYGRARVNACNSGYGVVCGVRLDGTKIILALRYVIDGERVKARKRMSARGVTTLH